MAVINAAKVEAVLEYLARVNTVMAQRPVRLTTEPNGPAPAWTDLLKDISYFSMHHLTEAGLSLDGTLELLLGLNYHELSHILYTPVVNWEDHYKEADPTFYLAFNILEDHKIETLLAGAYPKILPLFIKSAESLNMLDDTQERADTRYLIICGRYFLDQIKVGAIRNYAKNEHSTVWVNKADAITAEYRTLTYPEDRSRMIKLIKDFADLLPKNLREFQTYIICEGHGHDAAEGSVAGQKANQDKSDRIKTGVVQPSDEELDHGLDEARRELSEALDKYSQTPGSSTATIQSDGLIYVSDKMQQISIAFENALEMFLVAADPGWDRRRADGRINVSRYMREGVLGYNEAWDRWREDVLDATRVSMALLIDLSGSMDRQTRELAEATWVIKRALQARDSEVLTLGYDTASEILYGEGQLVDDYSVKVYTMGGGTDPNKALKHAYAYLTKSQNPCKILAVLTDGQWYGGSADGLVRAMGADGITTAIAGYGTEAGDHGADITVRIDQLSDFVELAKNLTLDVMTRALRRQGMVE